MLARILAVSLVALFCFSGCSRQETSVPDASEKEKVPDRRLKIAVIPKGTTHEFWKSVHAGAVKASKEMGVGVVWKGPLKEDDLKQQIDLVQTFTAQKVDGIVLAPLNDKALVKVVKDATRSSIPVAIIDSGLQGSNHISFVATDNLKAGGLAGERMAKLLGGKGSVVVLRYQEGSASTAKREKGFLDAIKKHSGIEVVSENQYGGATTQTAFKAAENLLAAKSAADGKVSGVFCPNESTTFGMLLALQKLGLAGKIKFVGFDASEKLVKALSDKQIDALVVQDPFNMGYLGVKTMVTHIRGQLVAKLVDTGATVVDRDSMNLPNVQGLLKPDLKKWLGE